MATTESPLEWVALATNIDKSGLPATHDIISAVEGTPPLVFGTQLVVPGTAIRHRNQSQLQTPRWKIFFFIIKNLISDIEKIYASGDRSVTSSTTDRKFSRCCDSEIWIIGSAYAHIRTDSCVIASNYLAESAWKTVAEKRTGSDPGCLHKTWEIKCN